MRSLAEYDAQIEKLTREREAQKEIVLNPEQRAARAQWRERLIGRVMPGRGLTEELMATVRQAAAQEGSGVRSIFDEAILQDDGWALSDGLWRAKEGK